ncbi:MAG: carbohydrate ABC transporter permease [Ruminococcaceae bacterium]|nr:carbohydrate ABC transporter permease [Oscillospiraceae bacterium]
MTEQKPVIKKESKNKIRVEFDRTPLKERLKARFLNLYFLGKIVWWIFRMVLLVGISYIVLFPFLTKIAGSFMAPEDFVDVTVRLIPKNFTLDIYRAIIEELNYWSAFRSTFLLSLICAVLQMLVCALIGYGFAKFKFKGRNLIFLLVMLTMVVPHQTLQLSMFMEFRYFDIFGIIKFLKGGGIELFGHNIKELGPNVAAFFEKINIPLEEIKLFKYTVIRRGQEKEAWKVVMDVTANGINLCNTYAPMILLSLGGLAFKNGLYIFLLRQFFRGIPDELEESAYMDGCGTFRTFVQIILPLSVPMLITVFMFAFCWQWTDDFYTNLFFVTSDTNMLVKIVGTIPSSLKKDYAGQDLYYSAIRNTCGIMIIFPLVILYAFGQRYLVQGIEQSGLAN